MQTIRILCVGKLKEQYWRDACAEYAKRLRAFCKFSIEEIPAFPLPETPSNSEIQQALEKEGEKLLALTHGDVKIVLAAEGQAMSSPEFASRLNAYANAGASHLCFLIGSSYGLSDSVKREASLLLSMSPMIFPHQLARVILCEQIYRSQQILHGGKYHK